jgi:hypothetical protein
MSAVVAAVMVAAVVAEETFLIHQPSGSDD